MPLDADDISRLYDAHARSLVTYFARRTFDAEAAVELAAETFAAAVTDRASFRGDGPDSATAWLYAIARHQLSGWYRRARVEREALGRLGLEVPTLTDVEYERIEELADLAQLRTDVVAGLEELTHEQRRVLRLRIVDERPYPEIAQALGITEQTARARVSRAVRALAQQLGDPAEEVGARGRA